MSASHPCRNFNPSTPEYRPVGSHDVQDDFSKPWPGLRQKVAIMPKRSTDAAFDKIRDIHARWLDGTLASEDVLFQISDVIQTHDAGEDRSERPVVSADQ
jgi:hypothetical protein